MWLVEVGDDGGWWLTRRFWAVVAVKDGGEDGGDVVMKCRICGGYDVEGGDGGAAWSGSEVGGARQVAAAVVVARIRPKSGRKNRRRRKIRERGCVSGKTEKLSGMSFYIKLL
ncbi:hypothetical protein Tco_1582084 [Tanacetum coccineum]